MNESPNPPQPDEPVGGGWGTKLSKLNPHLIKIAEKWIKPISFGKYALAAMGLALLVAIFSGLGGWTNIAENLGIALGLAVVLFILSVATKRIDHPAVSLTINIAICVIIFLALFWAGAIVVLSIRNSWSSGQDLPETPVVAPAPDEFTMEYASERHFDLPDNEFGASKGQKRHWMEIMDEGGIRLIENDSTIIEWKVTKQFTASHGTFDAHVFVGTNSEIEIAAFLVRTDPFLTFAPLVRNNQGPQSEYEFSVPTENMEGDRLMVFLAIAPDVWQTIRQNKQAFRIGSRSINSK